MEMQEAAIAIRSEVLVRKSSLPNEEANSS
jgi:hypothetical protein